MNGTTWIISLPTWRDHVQKGGQTFQPRNAFNHLTMVPQDKWGFKLLFRKHSSFRIIQWHSLLSCTELVWYAGTEHTLSLENITLFIKTSISKQCWCMWKGRKLVMILLLNRSWILPRKYPGTVQIWSEGKHVGTHYNLDFTPEDMFRTG